MLIKVNEPLIDCLFIPWKMPGISCNFVLKYDSCDQQHVPFLSIWWNSLILMKSIKPAQLISSTSSLFILILCPINPSLHVSLVISIAFTKCFSSNLKVSCVFNEVWVCTRKWTRLKRNKQPNMVPYQRRSICLFTYLPK